MPAVNNVLGRRRQPPARPRPSCSPTQASQLTSSRSSLSPARSDPGSRCKATRCGSWPSSASGARRAPPAYPFDSIGLATPDGDGTLLADIPDARTGGPDFPAAVGMPRPDLARILPTRAAAAGTKLRFGTMFTAMEHDPGGVDITFSDGSAGRTTCSSAPTASALDPPRHGYPARDPLARHGDLARLRPRPDSVVRTDLYYGGPVLYRRLCPTGENRSTPTSSRPRRTAPP